MRKFTATLIVATLSAYLLVGLGAMTAATELRPVAAGHYGVAGSVWLLVGVVAFRSWAGDHTRRVRFGSTVAFAAFPVQAALGAATALEIAALGGRAHLLGGLFVFGSLLVTLVWHLDGEVGPDGSGRAMGLEIEQNPPEDALSEGPTEPDAAATNDGPRSDAPPESGRASIRDRVGAYITLTKPRLMWLLCLLAVAGMALATITGATLEGVTVVATLAGGVLAIGAAGTFNHVYERERDRRMDRTADRPLVSDRVDPTRALAFGATLFVASMAVLWALVNPLSAALTAVAAVYYAVVYTVVLKPSTTWNTVLGGGAGALPAVIGWTAVTGSVGLPAVLLSAVVFCWTPAHFYNLAIACRADYDAAGYPMLPVERGVALARRRILYWLGATLLVAGGLGVVAGFGPLYAVASAVAGLGFVWTVAEQYRRDTDRAAYRSFHASNAYLGTLLVAVLLETVVV
ncbi:heme o synthase [Natronomonas sp. F2-12]|jgi:protoheme IX farnesyltransferase|uniref:Protoheme IX farnesyltransferase n=1 Tax=Natronomonas aquatica TaxID=2841590 RepID=A0A9R1CQ22_9EURY|nr:heme o synthase [Natronomonas aquatica]MCQ4332959.1 heme o synthase [Natronomonas aquatica]